MKKLIYTIILLLCTVLLSCELETSSNGDLDGFWQLKSIDSLSRGASTDMKSQQVFWSVQCDLLQATKIGQIDEILFRFQNTGDSLLLSTPYIKDRETDDTQITDVSMLQPMGINSLEEHFKIIELSGSTMTLESPTLRLYFRKY